MYKNILFGMNLISVRFEVSKNPKSKYSLYEHLMFITLILAPHEWPRFFALKTSRREVPGLNPGALVDLAVWSFHAFSLKLA